MTLLPRTFRWLSLLVAVLAFYCPALAGTQTLPPKPARYVEDPSGALSASTRQALISQLQQYERETSNQVVVAIYPDLPAGADLADYSIKTFKSWQIGQADKRNGVGFFIYLKTRKLYISTGYGLEGVLPDATARLIIENEATPPIRNGQIDAGVQAGVNAILAATKGEYKGTGTTVDQKGKQRGKSFANWLFWFVILAVIGLSFLGKASNYGTTYRSSGSHNSFWLGFLLSTLLNSTNRGGCSGGGGSWGGSDGGGNGGDGGFTGGGGDTGGGGAGGSW